MANLRDKGYPSAKEYRPNRSDKRNTPMNNGVANIPFNAIQTETPGTRIDPSVDKLLSAYNRKAIVNNMPLARRVGTDYVTDDTDERAYTGGINFDRNGERVGYIGTDIRPDRTSYYAGIDNLPFGENMFGKEFNTPYGTFGADYDGDGTASLRFETSPNLYYAKALANLLLNRGSL